MGGARVARMSRQNALQVSSKYGGGVQMPNPATQSTSRATKSRLHAAGALESLPPDVKQMILSGHVKQTPPPGVIDLQVRTQLHATARYNLTATGSQQPDRNHVSKIITPHPSHRTTTTLTPQRS